MSRKPKYKALTPGQQAFVDAYLISPNAVQSYRIAFPGTTYRTAAVQAHRLLKKPNIRAEIQAARRDLQRRTQVTARKVISEIANIAFADPIDLFDEHGQLRGLRDVPRETRLALASVKVKQERTTRQVTKNGKTKTTQTIHESVTEFKFWNKLDALAKLGNRLGLNTEIAPVEALLQMLPRKTAEELRAALVEGRNGKPAGRSPDQGK